MENAERHGRQRQEIGRRIQRRHARGGGSLREKGKVGKRMRDGVQQEGG